MTSTQTSSPTTNAPFGISTYTDQAVQEWFLNRTNFDDPAVKPGTEAEWAEWAQLVAQHPDEVLIPTYDRDVFGCYSIVGGSLDPQRVGYIKDEVHDGWDVWALPSAQRIIRVTGTCAHVFTRMGWNEWRKATFLDGWAWEHGHLRVAAAVVVGAPLSPVFKRMAKSARTAEIVHLWSPSQNNMPEVGAKVAVERNDDTFEGGEIVFIDPDPDTANPVRVIFSDGEDVWAPLYDVHPLDVDAGE